ncbi:hypothetical protein [Chitinophaga arvensicola]|uniref:Zinc-finger n=1 Tax=Chitinophaga arvensicola TaxID=29529 RepID=A0A1I0R6F9_9BACT|nr:hypothetical protein [Chitinophaga arvensicola]SEW36202.1 hypothetical protein SAMN04488122_2360 [Chitinophaga arvensicola]
MGHHLHTLLPCCKEATLLAEKQLQQPLPLLQRIGLQFHLLYCFFCRRYVKQSRIIDQQLRALQASEGPALEESVKLQWEEKIAAALKK